MKVGIKPVVVLGFSLFLCVQIKLFAKETMIKKKKNKNLHKIVKRSLCGLIFINYLP